MKKQAISKGARVALVGAFALVVSNAFAQEASDVMSQTRAASGTMSKDPMSKDPMSKGKNKNAMKNAHAKKSGSASMQRETSGTKGQ